MFDGINYYDEDARPADEQPITWDDLPECIHHYLSEKQFDTQLTEPDVHLLRSMGIDPRLVLNY